MSVNIPKQPYGLMLPIQHGSGGYFNQSYTMLDQIKSNLVNLLLTVKGERRMNPEFGSSLSKCVFETNVDDLQIVVESAINKDIQTWMPYVSVKQITVDIRNEYRDAYALYITVMFTVNSFGTSDVQQVDITLTKPII